MFLADEDIRDGSLSSFLCQVSLDVAPVVKLIQFKELELNLHRLEKVLGLDTVRAVGLGEDLFDHRNENVSIVSSQSKDNSPRPGCFQ